MIWHIVAEPCALGPFSPRRSPSCCLSSLSSVRLGRRMRNHDIQCRKFEPRQHRHDVAPALEFDHALLSGQGPVVRLRRRLAVKGRDDQAQGVCQGVMPHVLRSCQSPIWIWPVNNLHLHLHLHLGHLGYLLADHRVICFGSNSCTTFARHGGHVSGNVVPQAVPDGHNEPVVIERHASAWDGGQEGPGGPSRRATDRPIPTDRHRVQLNFGGHRLLCDQHAIWIKTDQ